MFHVEIAAIIIGSIGSVVGFLTYVWKRLIKPLARLVQNHDVFIKSVDELKEVMQKELSTNGGNSLKDAIIDLKKTCHRIEQRQKIIEQRKKDLPSKKFESRGMDNLGGFDLEQFEPR